MRSHVNRSAHLVGVLFVLSGCGLGSSDDFATNDDFDSLADDVQALAERVAVMESGGSSDGLETRVSTLEDGLASVGDEIDGLQAELDGVLSSIDDLEDAVGGLPTGSQGGTWWTTGSGTGTCAFLTVTTTSAEPVFVSATVNASYLQAQGQSVGGSVSASLTAASSDGVWTDDGISGATALTVNIPDENWNYTYAYTNYVITSGVMPLTWAFEIPRAGTYILRLEVTTSSSASSSTGSASASASDCTLLAWQVG